MDYKSMFEQAVRTLASIDDALGIGDDGCADPDMTLTAISELKAAAQRGEELARKVMADQVSDDSGERCPMCEGKPAPRRPLTSAQIRAIEVEVANSVLHNHPTDAEALARAVEMAHGIVSWE